MPDVWPAEELKARVALHHDWLRDIASRTKCPTLWLYGSRDPFYSEAVTREMFAVFTQNGGAAKYVLVSQHSLPTGHNIGQAPELWERDMAEFLASIEKQNWESAK